VFCFEDVKILVTLTPAGALSVSFSLDWLAARPLAEVQTHKQVTKQVQKAEVDALRKQDAPGLACKPREMTTRDRP